MIRRLRLKFICVNMAIVLVMMALMTVAVLYFTQRSLARESLHAMQQIAMDPLRPQAPGEAADGVRLPYFVLEVDETGAVHAAGGGYYDLSDTGFLAQAAAQIEAEGAQSGVLRAYGLRFLRAETPHGKYIVFADMSHEHSTLSGLLRTCLRISLAGGLVFLAISTLLAHLAVRPVEEAWAQQKQFVADASHELKTPLTVLLANAELMCAEGSTPCEQQALARVTLAAARRMRSLVEKLLELARADGGVLEPARTRLDWAQETNEALLPFEPLCFEKGLVLDTRLDAGIFVRGDAALLQQLAAILLDNACKYSSPGTVVRVVLKRRGKRRAVLSVANWGQPIPAKELANIFKRFYRMDAARSQSEGHGLGLSIAQQIVRRHGGKIWAESENGQNTFYAELPCTVK